MTATDVDLRALDRVLGACGLFDHIGNMLRLTEVADDEIRAAQRRHRDKADLLYHSFMVLTPTGVMSERAGFVYESHVRELLDRVIKGQDTRPGTAAEVALACAESSMLAPLTSVAAGLYGRMWTQAGWPGDQWDIRQLHHEALESSLIDDAEREMRRKLTDPDRRLPKVDNCGGKHWGKVVRCKYAQQPAVIRPSEPIRGPFVGGVQLELA